MNRAERRRLKRNEEERQANHMYSQRQLEEMMQKEREKACEFAFLYMMHFSISALRDEFDFGSKRLERFVERTFEKYRCFDKDHVKVEEIRQEILKEVGIDIVLEGMKQLEKK